MMTRLLCYLDTPTPYQLKTKQNVVKVGPPLTKFSGSAHEGSIADSVVADQTASYGEV